MGNTSQTPADLLPAKETVALFEGITKADRNRIVRAFPIFSSFPLTSAEKNSTVAFLALKDHTIGWASFSPSTQKGSSFWDRFKGKQYSVTFSGNDVAILFQEKGENPLSSSEAYNILHTQNSPAPSAFFDLRFLASGSGDALLLSSLTSSPFAAMHWSDSGVELSLLPKHTDFTSLPSSLTLPLTLDPTPTFSAAFASPSDSFNALRNLLPREQQMIMEGFVRKKWEDLFGRDASFAYDLPPLFASPGSLSLGDGTGALALRFLIETSPTREATAAVARLHQDVQSLLQPFAIKERTFTHDFSARTIEPDPHLISNSRDTLGKWTFDATEKKGVTGGLYSAQSDDTLLVSNDASWLARAISDLRTPPPTGETPLLARGSLSQTFLNRVMNTSPLLTALLRDFGQEKGVVSFSLGNGGNLVTLSIHGESSNRN